MCHFYIAVDVLVKLLKRKTFILEKFLDTAFQPPIRFFPESSDGFLNLRWNYSPLKERPSSCRTAFYVYLCRCAPDCLRDSHKQTFLRPLGAAGSARKSASPFVYSRECRFAPHRGRNFSPTNLVALEQRARRASRPRPNYFWENCRRSRPIKKFLIFNPCLRLVTKPRARLARRAARLGSI